MTTLHFQSLDVHGYVVEITDAVANGLLVAIYLKQGVCVVSPTSTQLGCGSWWWFHGFSNQTTMLAITWGTKNEGSFVRLARLARNTAQTAKLLLVQINSKTQASQLKMCIYIDLQKALEDEQASCLSLVNLAVGNAPLGACGSLMQQMALFSDY